MRREHVDEHAHLRRQAAATRTEHARVVDLPLELKQQPHQAATRHGIASVVVRQSPDPYPAGKQHPQHGNSGTTMPAVTSMSAAAPDAVRKCQVVRVSKCAIGRCPSRSGGSDTGGMGDLRQVAWTRAGHSSKLAKRAAMRRSLARVRCGPRRRSRRAASRSAHSCPPTARRVPRDRARRTRAASAQARSSRRKRHADVEIPRRSSIMRSWSCSCPAAARSISMPGPSASSGTASDGSK